MSDSNAPTLDGSGTVRALADHDLDPLFWRAELLHPHSAWCAHIPFAHWVVRAAAPRILVELGTHTGVSYSAFCLAVEREKLDTKCFAVDTWKGDEQAGYYGDEVFSVLQEHHRNRFSAFSTLIRSRFDDAAEFFDHESIDLLHIDGYHTYEATSHDFATWRNKLSRRAVVLFHDTNVLRDDFGVWRFWAEIRRTYPSFEFFHGNGLGVLVVGDCASPSIVELCKLTDPAVSAAVRDRFALIGERWEVDQSAKWRAEQQALNTNMTLDELRHALSGAQQETAGATAAKESAHRSLKEMMAESASLLETARLETSLSQEATLVGLSSLEEVRAELQQATTEVSEAREITRLTEFEVVHAEREVGRLRREFDSLRDWAANEHALLRHDVVHAHELTTKEREIGRRHARARSTAEARLRAAQQRMAAIELSPGWTLASSFERGPAIGSAVRFVYRLITLQFRRRRAEYALREAQQRAEAEKDEEKAKAVRETGLFDSPYYVECYPDVVDSGMTPETHYAIIGWLEGRWPRADFDPDFYLSEYPDVAKSGLNPLLHYAEHGRREGRLSLRPSPLIRSLSHPPSVVEEGVRLRTTVYDLVDAEFPTLRPLPVFRDVAALKSLTIVTDSLGSHSLFGGVGTALVVGTLMARRLGRQLRIATRHDAPDAGAYGNILTANGIYTDINPEFIYLPLDGSRQLSMGSSDLILTTSWWTTRSAIQSVPPANILYLLQEDERMFYPFSDHRLRCDETLKDDRIRVIVNTEVLFNHLASGADPLPGLKERGSWFKPAFPSIGKPDWHRQSLRRNFFFYARPHHARNLFWRGLEAIEASIEEGVLETSQWNFLFAGSDVPPILLPGGIEPSVVSHLPWNEYAAFVSTIDLGLSLMDTPHPSYPPIDLAAAGAVVVTSQHPPKLSLDEWSQNILCASPTVEGLKEGLRRGVALALDPVARKANYEKNNIGRDWNQALEACFQHVFASHC